MTSFEPVEFFFWRFFGDYLDRRRFNGGRPRGGRLEATGHPALRVQRAGSRPTKPLGSRIGRRGRRLGYPCPGTACDRMNEHYNGAHAPFQRLPPLIPQELYPNENISWRPLRPWATTRMEYILVHHPQGPRARWGDPPHRQRNRTLRGVKHRLPWPGRVGRYCAGYSQVQIG